MPDIPSYPPALVNEPVVVVGDQDGTTRRATLPATWHYTKSTAVQVSEGVDDTSYATPVGVARATEPQRNILNSMWGSKAGIDVLFTGDLNTVPGDAPRITTDVRTASYQAGTFILTSTPGAANIVSADTQATHGTFRLAIAGRWVRNNVEVYRFVRALYSFSTTPNTLTQVDYVLVNNVWVELPVGEFNHPMYISDPRGVAYLEGYRPVASRTSGFIATRHETSVRELSLSYVHGNASPYRLRRDDIPFSTPASNITLSQITTLLSGATGDARASYTWFKDRPDTLSNAGVPGDNTVGTSQLQDLAVTDAKVANVSPAKILVADSTDGYVLRNVGGTIQLSQESTVAEIGDDSVGEGAYQAKSIPSSAPKDNFLLERHFNSRIIPAGACQTDSIGTDELDPTGGSAGDMLGLDSSGNPAYITPPAWEAVAGIYTPTAATGTKDLNTGKSFDNYTEVFFQGRGNCQSLTIPAIAWNATSSTNRINLAVGASGHAQIYRSGATQFTYVEVADTTHANHGIQGVWGR